LEGQAKQTENLTAKLKSHGHAIQAAETNFISNEPYLAWTIV